MEALFNTVRIKATTSALAEMADYRAIKRERVRKSELLTPDKYFPYMLVITYYRSINGLSN